MKASTSALRFSNDELCSLLGLLGPSVVIGMANPFAGMSPNIIARNRDYSIRSLINKGLIYKIQSTNGLQIKSRKLISILKIISYPKHSVLVTTNTHQGSPRTRTFHYSEKNEIYSIEEVETGEMLISGSTQKQVYELLASPFSKRVFMRPDDVQFPVELYEIKINSIRELVQRNKEKDALKILLHTGVNESTAGDVLYALCKPDINIGIAVFSNRNEIGRRVRPFGVVAYGKYLWTIEASNQKPDTAILRQASKDKLFERFELMLPS